MIELLGLFGTAFLAATLLPMSSEAVLAALRVAGRQEAWLLLAVATAGNTLGGLANWALGRFALRWQDRRWFPFKAAELARATTWFDTWGRWSLLLSWVPVIGDPLTFVAGILRVRVLPFLLLVALGKAGRYLVVLIATEAVIS